MHPEVSSESHLAQHELQVYHSIVDERKRHLVMVELLHFDNMPARLGE